MDNWQEVVLPEDGKLADLVLLSGSHPFRQMRDKPTVCVMEAVAWLAGEPHSDHPPCACPVLGAFLRRTNDSATDEQRQELRQFIPQIVGSKSTKEVERRRAFIAADFAVRVFLPVVLEHRGRKEDAATCRALAEVKDKESAVKAQDVAREIRRAAYAHADADAYAYAYAAAYGYAAAYAYAYADADADAAAYAYADADAAAYAYAYADADADAVKTLLWPHRLDLIRAMLAVKA